MEPIRLSSGFLKSSFSGQTQLCVALRYEPEGVILAHTGAPQNILMFTYDEWDAFVKGVKAGEFDERL